MSAATRKAAELAAKLGSLGTELDEWRERSAGGKELAKHQSQIKRVADLLEAAAEIVKKQLDALDSSADGALSAARRVENQILELHRIWNYFRSKLALRLVDGLRDFLAVADELAFRCYEPVREASVQVAKDPSYSKEPPLVFFNGGASPFILTRAASWSAEPVGRSGIQTQEFVKLLERLPVPIIGVPWFQIAHLPDVLVIGHEVGHCVEADFRLALPARATAAAPKLYGKGWKSWASEAFADVYGAVALGPPFGSALADFLLDDPKLLQQEQPNEEGAYPPAALRVALVVAALDQIGFGDEARELRKDWSTAIGASPLLTNECLDDVAKIAAAFATQGYAELGDKSLKQLFPFGAKDQEDAGNERDRLIGDPTFPLASGKPAVLLCAARLAFASNPQRYEATKAAQAVIAKVIDIRGTTVRADDQTVAGIVEAGDRKTGAHIADLITEYLGGKNERDSDD